MRALDRGATSNVPGWTGRLWRYIASKGSCRVALVGVTIAPLCAAVALVMTGRAWFPVGILATWTLGASPHWPVKNWVITDVPQEFGAWAVAARHILASGHLPTWIANEQAGLPLLGNGQSGLGSPFIWPALFLPFGVGWTLGIALKISVALAGTVLFLSRYVRRTSALVGAAIVYGLGFFLTVWLQYPIASGAVWLPVALYGIDGLLADHRRRRHALALLIASYGACAAGNLETTAMVLGAVVAYAGCRAVGCKGRGVIAVGSMVGAGALLAGPVLLPFALNTLHSALLAVRETGVMGAPRLISPRSVVLWLDPFRYGVPPRRHLSPFNFNEDGVYFGAPALALGLVGLRRWRSLWPVVALGAIGATVAYIPPAAHLAAHVPIARDVLLTRMVFLTSFAVACLVGSGLDDPAVKWQLGMVGGAIIVACLVAWASFQGGRSVGLEAGLAVAALLALATNSTAGRWLAAGLCALGFVPLSVAYNAPGSAGVLRQAMTAPTAIRREAGKRAFILSSRVPPNVQDYWHVPAFGAYDMMGPGYVKLYNAFGEGPLGDRTFFLWPTHWSAGLARISGATILYTGQPLATMGTRMDGGAVSPVALGPGEMYRGRLPVNGSINGLGVFLSSRGRSLRVCVSGHDCAGLQGTASSVPRLWMAHLPRMTVNHTGNMYLDIVNTGRGVASLWVTSDGSLVGGGGRWPRGVGSFEYAGGNMYAGTVVGAHAAYFPKAIRCKGQGAWPYALIGRDPGALGVVACRRGGSPRLQGRGQVLAVRTTADGETYVKVEASGGSWVVVPKTFAEGMRASVRGSSARPLEIRQADGPFTAVRVPGGITTVALRYDAPGLVLGLVLAVLGGVVCLAALGPGRLGQVMFKSEQGGEM